MELKERQNILFQAAEIIQKKGLLTLDDAVIVKSAIENIKENKLVNESVNLLVKIVNIGQQKGAFTLKDAFYIYLAIDGIESELPIPQDTKEEKGED